MSSYAITRQGDTDIYNIVELCVDKREDVEKLPKNFGAGSRCLVIEDSSVHILNTDRTKWKELK